MGVLEQEIAAYRFLERHGPSTPTVVAKQTNQSRGRIYHVLRALVEKSFAREQPTRPVRYAAVPMRDILAIMVSQANRRLGVLSTAYAAEMEPTSDIASSVSTPRPVGVSIVNGRRASWMEVRRVAIHASKFFLIGGNGQLLRRLARSYPLLGEIRAAAARGVNVDVRVACETEADRDLLFLAEELGADRVHRVPAAPLPAFSLVATERVALLSIVRPDDGVQDQGADITVRVEGPDVPILVRALFPTAQSPSAEEAATATQLLSVMAVAKKEILVIGDGWSDAENPWAGELRTALTSAAQRGTPLIMASSAKDLDLSAWARPSPVKGPTPSILVVDRSFLFQVSRSEARVTLRSTSDASEIAYWANVCLQGAIPAPPAASLAEGRSPRVPSEPEQAFARARKPA